MKYMPTPTHDCGGIGIEFSKTINAKPPIAILKYFYFISAPWPTPFLSKISRRQFLDSDKPSQQTREKGQKGAKNLCNFQCLNTPIMNFALLTFKHPKKGFFFEF